MRRTMIRAATAVSMSALGLVFAGSTPVAAQPAAVRAGCGTDTGCLTVRDGVDSARIRTGPRLSSTVVGILYPGQTLSCWGNGSCLSTIVTGDEATDCGAPADNQWWTVNYQGQQRYVSYACAGMGG